MVIRKTGVATLHGQSGVATSLRCDWSSAIINLENDPRWRKLNDQAWKCHGCGASHLGVFDLGIDSPMYYAGERTPEPNSELSLSGTILTQDFCVLEGAHFFIRCVLELPINGSSGVRFGYGVWASLSKDNFRKYVEIFREDDLKDVGPWFGRFANNLKGYPDCRSLKCEVHVRPGNDRPLLELEPTEHPLALEQINGISFDRLLEIYSLNGHDIRPALIN